MRNVRRLLGIHQPRCPRTLWITRALSALACAQDGDKHVDKHILCI